MTDFTLSDLEAVVADRAAAPPDQSYTAKLLAGGPAKPAKKLGEEAVEAAIAAVQGDRAGLVSEAADVLYHLLVGAACRRHRPAGGDGGTSASYGAERHRRKGGPEADVDRRAPTARGLRDWARPRLSAAASCWARIP